LSRNLVLSLLSDSKAVVNPSLVTLQVYRSGGEATPPGAHTEGTVTDCRSSTPEADMVLNDEDRISTKGKDVCFTKTLTLAVELMPKKFVKRRRNV
jgi:hypothetical protein